MFDNGYFASRRATQASDQNLPDAGGDAAGPQPGDHPVGSHNTVPTTVSAYLDVAKDGENLAEINREAPNTAG